ncbi:MAG: MMPL family transporter [Spirochaetaceae bacterium]
MEKICKYPKITVIIISIITLFFAYNLKNVTIDNDTMKFLSEDNPERIAIDKADDIFGPSMAMSVGLEMKKGTIFTVEALDVIDKLTKEFEDLDGVDSIQSLTNSDFIDGIDGSLVVSPLVEDFTGSPEDVTTLKEKILSWDLYQDLLVSNDYSASQIMVTLKEGLGPDGQEKLYHDLKRITEKYENRNIKFYLAGLPSMVVLLSTNMMSDLMVLIPIVVIVLLIALFISFKRLSGILIPMVTVTISTIWTIGLMGVLGVPLSILGIIIPVLMMAVGSAYGIHVISHYYDDIKAYKGELTEESHTNIILKSLSYVKKPIFLAGLTTVAGFASLSISSIIPMRNFGIFTSVGIIFALIVALTLIPSLLVFNYKSTKKHRSQIEHSNSGSMERALSTYYESFGKRKYLILFMSLIIVILSAVGANNLIIDNSIVEYFKKDTHIRTSDRFLREKFTGTTTFNVIISGEGAGVDTELLNAMEGLSIFLTSNYEPVKKVLSFTDTVKRMNQVMHVDAEGSDGLDDFDDYSGEYDSDFDEDSDSFFEESDSFYDESDSFFTDDSEDEYMFTDEETDDANVILTTDGFMDIMSKAYAMADNPNISANELMTLLKKETNYKGFGFFEIPTDPAKYGHDELEDLSNLLSQYYAMTGKLEGFIGQNDDPLSPENIKMTIMMNNTGNMFTREIIPVVQSYIDDYFPEGYDVYLAGTALAQDSTTKLITSSAMNSIFLSLLMVFIILSVAYKSAFAGLFGMIPLAFTVLFNYGLMGLLGIKLDMSTAMVGSIAIGIGIDYTIHFMASYHKFSQTETCEDTVTKKSLMSSGKAIIFNALSVAAGFTVLLKSNFNPLMYLGFLIAITMLVASIASMTIMPGLLNIFKPKFIRK